ncbi:MAG: hypothetical protein V2G42_04070 [bacterium JZ-2024 1]
MDNKQPIRLGFGLSKTDFLPKVPLFCLALVVLSAVPAEDLDPRYLRYLGAVQVIFSGVKTYISYEAKLPEKFEDLAKSPYLAVRPDKIENPYSGKPMRFPKEPVLGDIQWIFEKDTLKLTATFKPRKNTRVEHSEMVYDRSIVTKWASEARSYGFGHDNFEYVMSLSHGDRWLYLSCFQVSFAMRLFRLNPYVKELPRHFKDLDSDLKYRQFFIFSIWNPYENREAREVVSPSPGDFMLKVVPTVRERTPILYCFNARGEPLSPSLREIVEGMTKLERPLIPE